jgi:hypothetical protein
MWFCTSEIGALIDKTQGFKKSDNLGSGVSTGSQSRYFYIFGCHVGWF